MHIRFTKMQGAGNDFVVLDETRGRLNLTAAQYRWLGDRHFGVGADQILTVRPAPTPDVDFEYVIHNGADGGEVQHCGTGACAAVVAGIRLGLLDSRVDVHTHGGVLTIEWAGGAHDSVRMTGPAVTVFEGEAEIPD